jgi:hypothetical protein
MATPVARDAYRPRSTAFMFVETLADPAEGGEAVNISVADHTFTKPALALYVGTTGNIAVVTWDGSELTVPNVPVGILPLRVQKVVRTGTTASNMIGLW